MNLPEKDIVGSPVTALTFKEQTAHMMLWARQRSSKVVCVANVHMLVEARHNPELNNAMAAADMVTPDGMPLVWMLKALGEKKQDRVAGMDIFLAICESCVTENVSIYLLGCDEDTLKSIQSRLAKEFPMLKVVGAESPPMRSHWSESELKESAERINNSGAGFTFVALGCPKQECWMAAQQMNVNSVMVGLGGVFPVYAGIKQQAPRWVSESGLEWVHRLAQEPRRLFKRYLTTIPLFIWLACHQLVSYKLQQVLSNRKVGYAQPKRKTFLKKEL
jgi:N-acetylglucosaminyldiphosphoundecaprenol N-acetyl-beta-D-mannosaminyltransferase